MELHELDDDTFLEIITRDQINNDVFVSIGVDTDVAAVPDDLEGAYLVVRKRIEGFKDSCTYYCNEVNRQMMGDKSVVRLFTIYSSFLEDLYSLLQYLMRYRSVSYYTITKSYNTELEPLLNDVSELISKFKTLQIPENDESYGELSWNDSVWESFENTLGVKMLKDADSGYNTRIDVLSDLEQVRLFACKNLHILHKITRIYIKMYDTAKDGALRIRADRSDYQNSIIFEKRLEAYRQKEGKVIEEKCKATLMNTVFKHNPVSSSKLKDQYEKEISILRDSELGKLYSDLFYYDSIEFIKELRKAEPLKAEIYKLYNSIVKCEFLDKWIEEQKDIEETGDPHFRHFVNVESLRLNIRNWIMANMTRSQQEWIAVVAAFDKSEILKAGYDVEKLCERLNRLFPKAEKKCSYESIRDMWPKKKMSEYKLPIDTWSVENQFKHKAQVLLTLLQKTKENYIKTE